MTVCCLKKEDFFPISFFPFHHYTERRRENRVGTFYIAAVFGFRSAIAHFVINVDTPSSLNWLDFSAGNGWFSSLLLWSLHHRNVHRWKNQPIRRFTVATPFSRSKAQNSTNLMVANAAISSNGDDENWRFLRFLA